MAREKNYICATKTIHQNYLNSETQSPLQLKSVNGFTVGTVIVTVQYCLAYSVAVLLNLCCAHRSPEVKMAVSQLCLTLSDSMDYAVHGSSRPEYWSG